MSRWSSLLSNAANAVTNAAQQAVEIMAPVMDDLEEFRRQQEEGGGGRGGDTDVYLGDEYGPPPGAYLLPPPRADSSDDVLVGDDAAAMAMHAASGPSSAASPVPPLLPPSVTVRQDRPASTPSPLPPFVHDKVGGSKVEGLVEVEEVEGAVMPQQQQPPPQPRQPQQPLSNHRAASPAAAVAAKEQQQRLLNQLQMRADALTAENVKLQEALGAAEDRAYRGGRVAQAGVRTACGAVDSLARAAGNAAGALVGDQAAVGEVRGAAAELRERVQRAVEKAEGGGGALVVVEALPLLLDEADRLVEAALGAAVAERSELLNGLGEVLDVRPPPREPRVLLARLKDELLAEAGLAEAAAEAAAWRQEREELLGQVAALQQQQQQQQAHYHHHHKDACEASAVAEALRHRCQELEARLAGAKRESPRGSGGVGADTPPQVQVEALKEEAAVLKAQCATLEAEVAGLRVEQEKAHRDHALSSSSSAGPVSRTVVEAASEKWRGKCVALEAEAAGLRAQAAQAQQQRQQEQEGVAALRRQCEKQATALVGLEAQLREAQAQVAQRRSAPPPATTPPTAAPGPAGVDPALLAQAQEEAASLRRALEVAEAEKAAAERAAAEAGAMVERAVVDGEANARAKEHEASQLRVVIEQQRALVRTKGEEVERLKREVEETRRLLVAAEAAVEGLVKEKDHHLSSMRAAEEREEGLLELQYRVEELQEELEAARAEGKAAGVGAREQAQELRERAQQAEHQLHELESALAAARADLGILQADYAQSETVRGNLQRVLEQFQWEKAAEVKHLERQHAKQLEEVEAAARTREEGLRRTLQGEVDEARAQAKLVGEQSEMEQVKARAQVEQARREAASLRKALDEAIARLRHDESDVVQRQLIGNLFVSFFSQGRPEDTLEIIARTLGFSDAERLRVGLYPLHPAASAAAGYDRPVGSGAGMETPPRGHRGGKGSIVGGLLSAINSPRKEFVPEKGTEGRSLGDLLTEYLLQETEAEEPSPVPDLSSLVQPPSPPRLPKPEAKPKPEVKPSVPAPAPAALPTATGQGEEERKASGPAAAVSPAALETGAASPPAVAAVAAVVEDK